jgi:hypothetical protein
MIVMRVNPHQVGTRVGMNSDNGTSGIIEEINNEIFSLLGYHREEVRGKNITMLMPKAIGAMHD